MITSDGDSGSAFFTWFSTPPSPKGGTNVLTGTNIVLSDGISITFQNGAKSPSFRANDRWYLVIRPNINVPTNTILLSYLDGGKMKCSTCHNQHSQAYEPFDKSAPPYQAGAGNGRHYMRISNDVCQLCVECHQAYNVDDAAKGSHPVGIAITNSAEFKHADFLPLDKTEDKIRCLTCHQVHNSPIADGSLLRTNVNNLCRDCHLKGDNSQNTAHLNSTNGVLFPGGQYGSVAPAIKDELLRGQCVNCHRVHGFPIATTPTKVYANLTIEKEELLCITCHDGSPVQLDIRTEFSKLYRHPVTSYTGRHSTAEYSDPTRYGVTNRHSECVDCHNPHYVGKDTNIVKAPYGSAKLKGVARVSVVNVTTNTVNYVFRLPSDSTPVKQYEVCFVCHSSFTTQPSGQSDMALKFNTMNASYHPVEGVGKNTNINVNAFVNNWRGDSMLYCTDCHSSDSGLTDSPHGSAYQYILKKPYTRSSASRTMSNNEICFDCHNYDTYANDGASNTVKAYSRFNPPAYNRGHTYHVGNRRYPCYACHDTHGSAANKFLIVTGRNPGLNSYTMTASGGTCAPTCHGSITYNSLNYAR
ncbi:MAG: cytochrome c3 family protein [Verrucomicrobiia bacterium]